MTVTVTRQALCRRYPTDPFSERAPVLQPAGKPVARVMVASPVIQAAPTMSTVARRLMRAVIDEVTARPGTALVPMSPSSVGFSRSRFAVGVRALAELNLIARHSPGVWWVNPVLIMADGVSHG